MLVVRFNGTIKKHCYLCCLVKLQWYLFSIWCAGSSTARETGHQWTTPRRKAIQDTQNQTSRHLGYQGNAQAQTTTELVTWWRPQRERARVRENRAPMMSRACVPDMRGQRVRYPSPKQRKHPDNDHWQPTSKSLDSSWWVKSNTNMVVKVIQFDARVDPILAHMDEVFAQVNPVFSFPWKCKGNPRHLVPWKESLQP